MKLIRKVKIMLQFRSSGYGIIALLYKKHSFEIKELFLSFYSWYLFQVTFHKLLDHTNNILIHDMDIVFLGLLSEKAQEACNKDIRKLVNDTNTNLLTMLFVISDCYLCYHKPRMKWISKYHLEVLNLLQST